MNENAVLIVEDEQDIAELIAMYMANEGYRVLTAFDGEEALVVLKAHLPNLILLDMNLPGRDGMSVCRDMRRITLAPILFLTSRDETEDMIDGLEAGADEYITKPFDPNVLVARVKAHLRRNEQYAASTVQRQQPVDPSFEQEDALLSDILSGQEMKIMRFIEQGYTNKEIADCLQLTLGTIKWYNNQIFCKLQVGNRVQAIARVKQLRDAAEN
ncbi:response regulator [Paenibacillus sp. TRM 82003]|nr:response regulator [Paenibacillus sp. TRM 82003]